MAMTNAAEVAQMNEIDARVHGYRLMANDPRATNDDRRLAISTIKEYQRQLRELEMLSTYRKLMSV
jgi:hypothetical protein